MRKVTSIILSLVFFLAVFSPSWSARADSRSDLRAKVGIKLFRTMLAADLDIKEKAGDDESLRLLLLYDSDRENAEKLGRLMAKTGRKDSSPTIRKLPISIVTLPMSAFPETVGDVPAGIFLTERLNKEDLHKLIEYGIKNRLILYSPFEGDVEEGVLGGLSVEAKVQPYINIRTLKKSGIRIKSFFMKVSKRYE